jgi:protein-tyrosine phosphatase
VSYKGLLPHPNCYRIPGSRVIAGEYPFHPDPTKGRAKLGRVLDAGVTTFVDLTEETEDLASYEAVLHEEAAARGLKVTYRRLSIVDHDVPTIRRMAQILGCICAAEGDGRTIYVHCWGGVGRTGTVAGCYLVRKGLSGDDALAQVRALFGTMSPGKTKKHWYTGSPQTEPQREFVRRWIEHDSLALRPAPADVGAARTSEQPPEEHLAEGHLSEEQREAGAAHDSGEEMEEEDVFEFDIDAILRELEGGPGFAPATLLPVICRALDEAKVKYKRDEAQPRVRFQIEGDEHLLTCILWTDEEKRFVCCSVRPPLWVPEASRAAMCEAMARANFPLIFGNFEMDLADGALYFRSSVDVREGQLTITMVHNLIGAGLAMWDRYHPAFMRVIYGGVPPEEAIGEVEP